MHFQRMHQKSVLVKTLVPIFFLNKVHVICHNLKSNKSVRDSLHFEVKSRFGMSGGRWGVIIGEFIFLCSDYLEQVGGDGWGVPPSPIP